jgi:hypothetical protein
MQLELSNFQPLAASEAIEEEVPDLASAEQFSEPMIEESDLGLASLAASFPELGLRGPPASAR